MNEKLRMFIIGNNYKAFINLFNTNESICKKEINNPSYSTHYTEANTLLHMATLYGCTNIVTFLIENGANPNLLNSQKQTALDIALVEKKPPISEILILHGATTSFTPDEITYFKQCPKIMLINNYLPTSNFLLSRSVIADVDIKNTNINFEELLLNALTNKYLYLADFLSSRGVIADVDIKNTNVNFEELLLNALTNKYLYLANFLLSKGVSANIDITNMNINLKELLNNSLISKLPYLAEFLLFFYVFIFKITDIKTLTIDFEELLLNSLKESCLDLADFLLSRGVIAEVDIKNMNINLEELLYNALISQHLHLVAFLLLNNMTNPDIKKININLEKLLYNALKESCLDLADFLLSRGVITDVDIKNTNLNLKELLLNALTNKYLYLANFLLSRDLLLSIDMENTNIKIEELLHNDLISKLPHLTDFLLFNNITNANITNMKNINLEELLYNALKESCLYLADLLLSNTVTIDITKIDSNKINWKKLFSDALTNRLFDLADFLLPRDVVTADIDLTNMSTNDLKSLLNDDASQCKHNKLFLFLSSYNEDLKITAFRDAVMKENFELASLLMSRDSSIIDHQDKDGNTLLHLALFKKRPKVTKYLLEHKANIYINNLDNLLPFSMIFESEIIFNSEFDDIIRSFFIPGDKKNDYYINPPSLYQELVIAMFRDKKNLKVAEILIKYLSDVNAEYKYDNYNTLLHWASENGYLDIAELLIKNGANVNACNLSNETPLHLASKYGHEPLVLLLLQKNALTDMQNKDGKIPFELACSNKRFELSYLLHPKNIEEMSSPIILV